MDASLYIKNIIKITVFMLGSCAYIVVSFIVCKYMYVRQQTYDSPTHEMTTTLPMMHLQCGVCMLSGLEKFRIVIY